MAGLLHPGHATDLKLRCQFPSHRDAVPARGVFVGDRLLIAERDQQRTQGTAGEHAAGVIACNGATAKLLDGRVTFTPMKEPRQWQLSGRGTFVGLFYRASRNNRGYVPNGK